MQHSSRFSWFFFQDELLWVWFYVGGSLIIAFRKSFSSDRLFAMGLWVVSFGTVCVALFLGLNLVRELGIDRGVEEKRGSYPLCLDEVVAGPLSLHENERSPLALTLEQKLVLLGETSRPDYEKGEKGYKIGILGSGQEKIVKDNDPFFLELTLFPTGAVEKAAFSASGFQVVPQWKEGALWFFLEGGEKIEIKKGQETRQKLEAGIMALSEAIVWGPDQLYKLYGGNELRPLGQKEKIEVKQGASDLFLFLSSQDYLSYGEGGWTKLSSLKEANKKAPLAKVEKVGGHLKVEAWDGEGFPLFATALKSERKVTPQLVIDQILTGPKLRSAKQVSCKIGKKRVLLKPGDWLLKTQTGWHKLMTVEEIDAYLNHKLQGELLVVDAIDNLGKMKGHTFDTMRTQAQPFAIQAVTSKKKTKKKGGK